MARYLIFDICCKVMGGVEREGDREERAFVLQEGTKQVTS